MRGNRNKDDRRQAERNDQHERYITKTKKETDHKKFTVTGLAKSDYITSWTSSNKKSNRDRKSKWQYARLSRNKTGKAKITITLASGLKKTINVTIQKKAVPVQQLKNVSKKLTLNKKKFITTKPVINPITCTNKIKYKSSNKRLPKYLQTERSARSNQKRRCNQVMVMR